MTSHGQTLLGEIIRQTINASEVVENHRPPWLNGLELDFWVPEWNLAFEFQGDQHYAPVFGLQTFADQAVRDKMKRRLCEANRVMLITFEASSLEPHKMKHKLWFHIARMHPDFTKSQRRKLQRQILHTKHGLSRREKLILVKKKAQYCRNLKASYGSPTAYRRGSKLRKAAKQEQWKDTPWWEKKRAFAIAFSRYDNKAPADIRPVPKIGGGMARAAKIHQ